MTMPNYPVLTMDPEEFEEWLGEMPEGARVVARLFPPDCYRELGSRSQRTHYGLVSYDEHKDTGAIHLTLQHGSDSHLPGVTVFGAEPANFVRCGCGKWRHATPAQLTAMREHFEALERARALARKD
jgi:hypothetical protein